MEKNSLKQFHDRMMEKEQKWLADNKQVHRVFNNEVKEQKWRANEITTDQDKELVRLVSSTLEWKTDRIRAFVVELLENCNDHQVAKQFNDILSKSD